jgi:hypothetical protein|tara:strand:+ start:246 stop:497 length:252 start_codon:yes stop_codon:yes gene_type:complete
MKIFGLVLYICSAAANTCIEPYKWPDTFDSSYKCMLKGYEQSYKKIEEMGPERVNEFNVYIKFDCLQIDIIVPKKKPVVELLT